MRVFKYNKKNSEDLTQSYWNGKERIGYTAVTIDAKDFDKYKAKGYTRELPTKPVRRSNVNKDQDIKKSLKGDEG